MSNQINGTDMTNPEHRTITATIHVTGENQVVLNGAESGDEWIQSNITVAREDGGKATDEAYAWVFNDE